MMNAIYSGLSAIRAIQTKSQVNANNVANVNTDGFKKSRATLTEGENRAVTVSIRQVETPGPQVYEQTASGSALVEKSNVELSEELPEMMISRRALQANVKTVRAQDEMLGYLLDIKG